MASSYKLFACVTGAYLLFEINLASNYGVFVFLPTLKYASEFSKKKKKEIASNVFSDI